MKNATLVAAALLLGSGHREFRKAGQQRWIVYRKTDDGLTYWTGDDWTPSRIDAKDFGSPAEASNFAAQHDATATKR